MLLNTAKTGHVAFDQETLPAATATRSIVCRALMKDATDGEYHTVWSLKDATATRMSVSTRLNGTTLEAVAIWQDVTLTASVNVGESLTAPYLAMIAFTYSSVTGSTTLSFITDFDDTVTGVQGADPDSIVNWAADSNVFLLGADTTTRVGGSDSSADGILDAVAWLDGVVTSQQLQAVWDAGLINFVPYLAQLTGFGVDYAVNERMPPYVTGVPSVSTDGVSVFRKDSTNNLNFDVPSTVSGTWTFKTPLGSDTASLNDDDLTLLGLGFYSPLATLASSHSFPTVTQGIANRVLRDVILEAAGEATPTVGTAVYCWGNSRVETDTVSLVDDGSRRLTQSLADGMWFHDAASVGSAICEPGATNAAGQYSGTFGELDYGGTIATYWSSLNHVQQASFYTWTRLGMGNPGSHNPPSAYQGPGRALVFGLTAGIARTLWMPKGSRTTPTIFMLVLRLPGMNHSYEARQNTAANTGNGSTFLSETIIAPPVAEAYVTHTIGAGDTVVTPTVASGDPATIAFADVGGAVAATISAGMICYKEDASEAKNSDIVQVKSVANVADVTTITFGRPDGVDGYGADDLQITGENHTWSSPTGVPPTTGDKLHFFDLDDDRMWAVIEADCTAAAQSHVGFRCRSSDGVTSSRTGDTPKSPFVIVCEGIVDAASPGHVYFRFGQSGAGFNSQLQRGFKGREAAIVKQIERFSFIDRSVCFLRFSTQDAASVSQDGMEAAIRSLPNDVPVVMVNEDVWLLNTANTYPNLQQFGLDETPAETVQASFAPRAILVDPARGTWHERAAVGWVRDAAHPTAMGVAAYADRMFDLLLAQLDVLGAGRWPVAQRLTRGTR